MNHAENHNKPHEVKIVLCRLVVIPKVCRMSLSHSRVNLQAEAWTSTETSDRQMFSTKFPSTSEIVNELELSVLIGRRVYFSLTYTYQQGSMLGFLGQTIGTRFFIDEKVTRFCLPAGLGMSVKLPSQIIILFLQR